MRLFPRRQFANALTALSVVLSVAIVAVWVRSVFYADVYSVASDQYDGEGKGYEYRLRFMRGGVLAAVTLYRGLPSTPCFASKGTTKRPMNSASQAFDPIQERLWRSGYRRWGYGIRYDEGPIPYSPESFKLWNVHFPLYVPLLIVASPTIVRGGLALRAGFRYPAGHCPRCGYDTRANPAKCSECGHAPAGD